VHKGLDDFLESIQRVFNRLVIALIVTGGLIGSSMIGIFATKGPQILGINAISVVGFALSTVLKPRRSRSSQITDGRWSSFASAATATASGALGSTQRDGGRVRAAIAFTP